MAVDLAGTIYLKNVPVTETPFTIHDLRRFTLAEKRTYELMFIVEPDAGDEDVLKLSESVQKIITGQGGSITKTEMMGKRQLAYEINHKRNGTYVLLEVEGSGAEIAEVERRMRVNDQILRYMTVRVDEMRRRADKLKDRRARKAAKKTGNSKSKAVAVGADSDEDESAA
jgi:small subunit ribosomal protein S6